MRTVLVEDQERPLVWVGPKVRHILESPKPLGPVDLEQIWAGYRAWLADPTAVLILQDGVRFRTLNPDGTITPEVTMVVEPAPQRLWPMVASAIGGVVIGFVAASGLA